MIDFNFEWEMDVSESNSGKCHQPEVTCVNKRPIDHLQRESAKGRYLGNIKYDYPSPDTNIHRPQILVVSASVQVSVILVVKGPLTGYRIIAILMASCDTSVHPTVGVQMASTITKIIKKKIGFVCSYKNLLN